MPLVQPLEDRSLCLWLPKPLEIPVGGFIIPVKDRLNQARFNPAHHKVTMETRSSIKYFLPGAHSP